MRTQCLEKTLYTLYNPLAPRGPMSTPRPHPRGRIRSYSTTLSLLMVTFKSYKSQENTTSLDSYSSTAGGIHITMDAVRGQTANSPTLSIQQIQHVQVQA